MPQPTGTGVLRGRVVGGESGAPLRHAVVHLSGIDMREGKMATTDEQGRWEIRDLPAGRFDLTASKGGYVTLQYGQRRPFQQGRPLELANGQTLDNVNFNLPRGGVIAGRINDEYGDPVAEAMVAVLHYRYFNGQRRLVPAGRFSQTDDGGNFRLYGLAPGDYYLSATLRSGMMEDSSPLNRSGYAPTYYPGTAAQDQAERVTVSLGAEVSGIAFALLPVRVAKLSGTAVDSEGRPMAGAFIMMGESTDGVGGGFSMMFGGGGRVDEAGHFTVNNVSPGEYFLSVRRMGPGAETDGESAQTRITVNGEDISGIALVGTKGATIKGAVSFETSPPPGSVSPASFSVYTTPKNPQSTADFMFAGGGRDVLNDDWTFELRGVVTGPVLVRPGRMPTGYVLKAVYLNAQDVTDSGISFRPGESISGVQVVLTTRASSVSGGVTTDKGEPVTDYVVVVFSDDPANWGFMSRRVAMARPDQQGAFQVKNLPAGRYLAVAVDYLEDGEQTNPETLERLRSAATSLELADGDQTSIALKLVTRY
jgi:hypothetical protein